MVAADSVVLNWVLTVQWSGAVRFLVQRHVEGASRTCHCNLEPEQGPSLRNMPSLHLLQRKPLRPGLPHHDSDVDVPQPPGKSNLDPSSCTWSVSPPAGCC